MEGARPVASSVPVGAELGEAVLEAVSVLVVVSVPGLGSARRVTH